MYDVCGVGVAGWVGVVCDFGACVGVYVFGDGGVGGVANVGVVVHCVDEVGVGVGSVGDSVVFVDGYVVDSGYGGSGNCTGGVADLAVVGGVYVGCDDGGGVVANDIDGVCVGNGVGV